MTPSTNNFLKRSLDHKTAISLQTLKHCQERFWENKELLYFPPRKNLQVYEKCKRVLQKALQSYRDLKQNEAAAAKENERLERNAAARARYQKQKGEQLTRKYTKRNKVPGQPQKRKRTEVEDSMKMKSSQKRLRRNPSPLRHEPVREADAETTSSSSSRCCSSHSDESSDSEPL